MPIQHLKIKTAEPAAPESSPGPSVPPSKQELRAAYWKKNRWGIIGGIALMLAVVGAVYLIIFLYNIFMSDQVEVVFDALNGAQTRSSGLEAQETIFDQIPNSSLLSYSSLPSGRKRFLVLLQNSTELRPTGGFIGNVAVVETNNGDPTRYYTSDSYSIDAVNGSDDASQFPIAPPPVKKYLGQDRLFFRDANWLPDFRDSAQLISQLYSIISNDQRVFDAVIALNPSVVSEALGTLGPITVDGIEFNQANLVDALEYEVEINAPVYKGKTRDQRKEIVNALFREIVGRALNASKKDKLKLVSLAEKKLAQKELQLYFIDSGLEAKTEQLKYAGAFSATLGDFIAVVDANVGALKTDQAIQRVFSYSLREENETLKGKLNLTYVHTGYFDWKTGVYKTFTRVYLPLGTRVESVKTMSELGVYEALPVEERGQYQGKSYIGFYVIIQPKSEGEVIIEYNLPDLIRGQLSGETYSLVIQKQSGTFPKVSLNIDVDSPFQEVVKGVGALQDGNFIGEITLVSDAEFILEL